MTDDQIQALALASGFTLKPQPDGSQALHPYVFEFARAVLAAWQDDAQATIDGPHQELEQTSDRFQRAHLLASQWQQRAELAERQRDEWRAVLVEELQARRGLQMHARMPS